jgi:tetratricopeptide (TPR) repeat protein
MWVVKEEGQYKILDGAENPNSIGLEILERFEKGNTAGARVLLDWVRDEEHLPGGDDPLAGYAFPRMWTKGKEADPGQMKVAAAAILAQTKETAGDSLTILEAARTSAKSDEEKLNVTLALVGAYGHLRAFDKLHTLASELEKQNPGSMRIFLEDEKALRGLSQYKEADALAAEMAKRLPDDLDVSRAFVQNAVARGDYESAHRLEGELVAKGKAESSDLNGFAWHALFTGKVSQEDLDTAIKAAQLNQGNNAPALHTLGCIYAEMGKTKEAREVLIQAMDQLFLDEPNDAYWYAFGRIAEQYGEKEVAAEDYAKLKRPKIEEQIQGSSYALAQLRLQAMRAVASSASDRKN